MNTGGLMRFMMCCAWRLSVFFGASSREISAEGLLTASFAGVVDGFVTTLHANSVRHTFTRLEHLLPRDTPREMIGEFVDFIIYCEEYVDGYGDNRYRIADLGRSFGFDPERKQYIIEPAGGGVGTTMDNDLGLARRTQAERFADVMAQQTPPIATGTVRRYLQDTYAEITNDLFRFGDGSAIERFNISSGRLRANYARHARAPARALRRSGDSTTGY